MIEAGVTSEFQTSRLVAPIEVVALATKFLLMLFSIWGCGSAA
jgi:hypothetical protein